MIWHQMGEPSYGAAQPGRIWGLARCDTHAEMQFLSALDWQDAAQHYCSGNELKNPEWDSTMRNICLAQSPAKNVNKIVDSTKAVTKCIGNTGFYKDIKGPFFFNSCLSFGYYVEKDFAARIHRKAIKAYKNE